MKYFLQQSYSSPKWWQIRGLPGGRSPPVSANSGALFSTQGRGRLGSGGCGRAAEHSRGRQGHGACVGQAAAGDCKGLHEGEAPGSPEPFHLRLCTRTDHGAQLPRRPFQHMARRGWHQAHPGLPAGCSPRSPPRLGWRGFPALSPWEGGGPAPGPAGPQVRWAGVHPAARWALLPGLLGASSAFGCPGTSCAPLAVGRGHQQHGCLSAASLPGHC